MLLATQAIGAHFRRLAGFAIVLTALAGAALGQGQSGTQTVTGPGGWPIHFTYYPAIESVGGSKIDVSTAPVVILLHGTDGSRLFWDKTSAPPGGGRPFAEVLQSQGFAVVAVDMRKHGDSAREGDTNVVATDYELMVGDLIAVKQFLYEEHQAKRLNMRKCGIVAMDDMVPVAATFAEYDWRQLPHDDAPLYADRTPRGQDIKALVLISPETNAGRVQATNSLRFLGNPEFRVAMLFVTGKKDTRGLKDTRTLHRVASNKGNESRVQLHELETNERSQHLFGNPRIGAELPVIKFLKDNVKDLDIPWQNRISRRERG